MWYNQSRKEGEKMNTELLKRYNNLYDVTERKALIADMLTAFREMNRLQKKDVAEYLGIKPQTYNAYESGRNEPPAEILVRLSLLYDVPIDVLVQKDNMSKTQKSAKEQLDYYDKQIDQLKEELIKTGNSEDIQLFLDGVKQLTEAMKTNLGNLPKN